MTVTTDYSAETVYNTGYAKRGGLKVHLLRRLPGKDDIWETLCGKPAMRDSLGNLVVQETDLNRVGCKDCVKVHQEMNGSA